MRFIIFAPSDKPMPEEPCVEMWALGDYVAIVVDGVSITHLETRTMNWEALKGWRTIIFGVIITTLASLQLADLIPVFGETWASVALAAIGVVVMALRIITTGSWGTK
jgi:hypothetical protein